VFLYNIQEYENVVGIKLTLNDHAFKKMEEEMKNEWKTNFSFNKIYTLYIV